MAISWRVSMPFWSWPKRCSFLEPSVMVSELTAYQAEATIAMVHAHAAGFEDTD
jgi:hypothetical protein